MLLIWFSILQWNCSSLFFKNSVWKTILANNSSVFAYPALKSRILCGLRKLPLREESVN